MIIWPEDAHGGSDRDGAGEVRLVEDAGTGALFGEGIIGVVQGQMPSERQTQPMQRLSWAISLYQADRILVTKFPRLTANTAGETTLLYSCGLPGADFWSGNPLERSVLQARVNTANRADERLFVAGVARIRVYLRNLEKTVA